MNLEKELQLRSESKCELCSSTENLSIYHLPPSDENSLENSIYACNKCIEQIENTEKVEANHWRCLNDSMWNPNPAVQIVAYRMLHRLKAEGWPLDLIDMMYLDEESLAYAKETLKDTNEDVVIHKDSNGAILNAGDTVVLIKDLNVKGANFTAKRGTAVRGISLVQDNASQIEGKVNGQQIVILTEFVKKS